MFVAISALISISKALAPIDHPNNLILASNLVSEAKKMGGTFLRSFDEINYSVVRFDPDSKETAYFFLKDQYGDKLVCRDLVRRVAYEPNDPMWPNMWHPRAINAQLAWNYGLGSEVVVAVIDTGVNVAHPDLAANVWVNSDEIAGNGIDDDSNGYIDDINGYDFSYNDPIANDVYGHGTACAGLVAAVQDNALGGTGIAPRAKIMALKASNDAGYFYDSQDIAAYIYAANNGAKILSMSFFGDGVTAAEKAGMDYAVSQGVLPVAAAGNDRTIYSYYPGAYDNVWAIAAMNTGFGRAGFSNYGSWVDVVTPGTSLITTSVGGGFTSGFAGTSGACPIAAGSAALVWGQNPSLNASQVRSILEDTAVPRHANPLLDYTSYGLLNVEAASQVALGLQTKPERTSVVRYATPFPAIPPVRATREPSSFRIQGRGFAPPHVVRVQQSGVNLPILAVTRDYIDVNSRTYNRRDQVKVIVDGVIVRTLPAFGRSSTLSYPLCEVAGWTGSTSGGFYDSISADSLFINALPDSLTYKVHGTFRRVKAVNSYVFHIRRKYTGTGTGTETIKLYNWATASYPYGSYVTISSRAVSAGFYEDLYINVPSAAGLADTEGTMYLAIDTTWSLEGSSLQIDQCKLSLP